MTKQEIKQQQTDNIMSNLETKFEVGNIYEMRFISDYELRPHYICTKRTEKMATLKALDNTKEIMNKRIKIDSDGNEYIVSGTYSMAPSISSKRVVG